MELQVEKIFKNKGINYRIIEISAKAITVEDVIKYSNNQLNIEEICKTIILQGKNSQKIYAIFMRGSDKIDFLKVKNIFGEEMKIANSEVVIEVSGVEPGAVCPLLLKTDLYIDENVLKLDKINCGSGDHLYGLEFEFKNLNDLVDYKVVNIAK